MSAINNYTDNNRIPLNNSFVFFHNDAFYRINNEGECLYANNLFMRMLGYNNLESLLSSNIIQSIYYRLKKNCFKNPESIKIFDIKLKTKSGNTITVKNISWIIYKKERPIYFEGIIKNIFKLEHRDVIECSYYRDNLTNLYNKIFFKKILMYLDRKDQLPISVILVNISSLRFFNEMLNQQNDNSLESISQIIKSNCRKKDIVARWNNDELIILLPQTQKTDVKAIVNRIKKVCKKYLQKYNIPDIIFGWSTKNTIEENIWKHIKKSEDYLNNKKIIKGTKNIKNFIISSLEKKLWEKDIETREHTERVKNIAKKMGTILNLPDYTIDELTMLGVLHDIGKIIIPDSILTKPGCLSAEEWTIMKKHSEIGYRIAKSSCELTPIARGILHHHEWWNGKGYPYKLSKKNIPLISRIITIIDAYDVMIHHRPYKKKISKKQAIRELKRYAGIQFDPVLTEIFINLITK